MTSDDQLFNRILRRSLDDLELLHSELDGQSYYAAGVPWFATLFGRDSLITAFETLSFVPGVAEGTLRLLAGRLGREYDDERDEEPGKVLHELRVGEPATLGETPFARYYGSVDATPLFLCLLGQYAELVRQPRPVPRAARAGGGRARVDRPLRRPRRRRARGVPAPLAARPRDAGLEGLGGRRPRSRRRAARGAGRARGGAGLRDPRQAADGAHVRAGRRRRARGAAPSRGRRGRGSARALLARGARLLRDRARRREAARLGARLEPGPPALGGRGQRGAGAAASATC